MGRNRQEDPNTNCVKCQNYLLHFQELTNKVSVLLQIMFGLLSLGSFLLLCCDPPLVLSNLVESLKLSQVAHGWLGINIKYLKSFGMVNKSYKTLSLFIKIWSTVAAPQYKSHLYWRNMARVWFEYLWRHGSCRFSFTNLADWQLFPSFLVFRAI